MVAFLLLAFCQAKLPEGLPLYKGEDVVDFLVARNGEAPQLLLPISGEIGVLSPSITVSVASIHDDGSFTASMTSFANRKFEHQTFRVYGYPTQNLVVLEKIDMTGILVVQSGTLTNKGLGLVFRDRILEVVDRKYIREAKDKLAKRQKDEADLAAKKKDQMTKDADAKKQADAAAKAVAMAEAAKAKNVQAQTKARDSITKLIRGLASYEQRYEDSFKESKESVMDQMQEQARTYIQGADKRLEAALKEMEAAKIPEDERAKLADEARAAIAKAKKKVGIK